MRLYYRFNRIYGIAGNVYGVFLILLGIFTMFRSWSGLILIILGSFMVFTVSACVIDVKKYRISFPYLLLGFINVGDWVYVRRDMELYLVETKKPFTFRCASNKLIDVSGAKYLIFLYNGRAKKQFLIFKTKSKEKAEDELARLSDLLGIHTKEDIKKMPIKIIHL